MTLFLPKNCLRKNNKQQPFVAPFLKEKAYITVVNKFKYTATGTFFSQISFKKNKMPPNYSFEIRYYVAV